MQTIEIINQNHFYKIVCIMIISSKIIRKILRSKDKIANSHILKQILISKILKTFLNSVSFFKDAALLFSLRMLIAFTTHQ